MRAATSVREHASSILVAGLGSAFGVALLGSVDILDQLSRAEHAGFSAGAVGILILRMMAITFLAVSLYVGGVVTANTFSTIVAGRVRSIALLRLLGSSAKTLRLAMVRESAVVGVVGAVAGGLVGLGLEVGLSRIGVALRVIPDLPYALVSPLMLLPLVAVTAATVIAGFAGSRGVLRVAPIAAVSSATDASATEVARRVGRHVGAALALVAGGILLAAGVVIGQTDATGVLVSLVGGILSFSGVVAAADVVMPACLRVVGLAFGSRPSARLASANALRQPDRSARATIGVVIGVTLVTTISVALTTLQSQIEAAGSDVDDFRTIILVLGCLTGFAGVIAAVGMVDNLSLSVLQRRRELGMLRVLGFTRRQVRLMILAEAAQITVASVVTGLVLGVFYGWCGAQAALGSATHSIVVPVVPVSLVVGLTVVALLLAVVASLVPARRATAASPIAAIRTL